MSGLSVFKKSPETIDENHLFEPLTQIQFTNTFMNPSLDNPFENSIVAVETSRIENLWTTAEVARYLQVSLKTVYNQRKCGLPFVQVGGAVRFDPQKVRDYVTNNHRVASHRRRQQIRKGAAS